MAKKGKPSVVILHGWGLSGEAFTPLVHSLTSLGFQAESLDFPGFGLAEIPKKPWGLAEYAGFLDKWIQKRKLKNPVLFGHSFGGRVALRFEHLYPGKAAAIILSGAPGYTPASRIRVIGGLFLTKLGGALFSLPLFNLVEDPVRLFWYRIIGAKDFLRPQKVMRDTFKKIVTERLVEPMRAVRCPCLLVWGEGDRIVPVSIARRMTKTIPGAQLIIVPDSRHGVPFKKPDIVAKIIDEFVRKI